MFALKLSHLGAVISKISYSGVAVALAVAPVAVAATAVLYEQDFENPFNFSNGGGDVSIEQVNQYYGDKPVGFTFAQNNTVETLNVSGSNRGTGTAAFGTGWSDPSGTAGDFALGMLSDAQNDILGLSFDVGGQPFLNVGMDISSIDLSTFGGPFVSPGDIPVFALSLFDNPGGGASTSGNGTLLGSQTLTGTASDGATFDWTTGSLAFDATGSTDGNVTLQVDLVDGGYAAIDNVVITASAQAATLGTVPLPASAWMLIASLGMTAGVMRFKRRNS